MHFNTLKHTRQQMYSCFERSRDALFNLCDALLSESQARSLPELSLSVFFERRWPSVYEALQDGRINVGRLRNVFVQALIESEPADEPIWVGIDSSSMERLEAESSRDRGMIYVPNMPHATKPVSVGWQFSTVMLLPEQPSSWVGVLEQRRIGTEQTAIEALARAKLNDGRPVSDFMAPTLLRVERLRLAIERHPGPVADFDQWSASRTA